MTSDKLSMFVPTAIRAIMARLAPRIEDAAGVRLAQVIDLNPRIPERISAGERFDVALTNPRYVEALVSAGRADGATHRAFGRVPLAVGRKAGTHERILRDVNEIATLFRTAESIAYTGAGTSGRTYLDAVGRLGLTGEILPKSHPMPGGEPVAAVAAGDIGLAIAPLTTVLSTQGVAPAAIFPEELETHIDISVFLSATPRTGAAQILAFLTAGDLDAELAAAGVVRFELS